MEEWKKIEGYPNHEVSNKGRVLNRKTGTMLKFNTHNKMGYHIVALTHNGVRVNHSVHRLVARHFILPEGKPCVNHIDSDPTNNHVENLEWCTHRENVQHSLAVGRWPKGETHSCAKLTEKEVLYIREHIGLFTDEELADDFGVTKENIQRIKHRRSWKHLPLKDNAR